MIREMSTFEGFLREHPEYAMTDKDWMDQLLEAEKREAVLIEALSVCLGITSACERLLQAVKARDIGGANQAMVIIRHADQLIDKALKSVTDAGVEVQQ